MEPPLPIDRPGMWYHVTWRGLKQRSIYLDYQVHLLEKMCNALRSLEIRRRGLGGDSKRWRISTEVSGSRDIITRKLSLPNAERIFFIRPAPLAGFTVEEILTLAEIDSWFLGAINEMVDFKEELAGARN